MFLLFKWTKENIFTQHAGSLWNPLPQDVVIAYVLNAFKRGLDRFLEEKSIARYTSWWGCIISRLQRKVPQNARCRRVVSGDRYLVVSHASRGIWWGYSEIWGAGLDGPLGWSSRAPLMLLCSSGKWREEQAERGVLSDCCGLARGGEDAVWLRKLILNVPGSADSSNKAAVWGCWWLCFRKRLNTTHTSSIFGASCLPNRF